MQKLPPSRLKIAFMVAFTLLCFGILLYLWKSFGGPSPLAARPYALTVDFPNATLLTETAEVRISGVPVGHVAGISQHGNRTRARLEIQPRFAPLPRDTRAILRQKTLLGETYVELTPGDRRSGALRDGGTLPDRQVQQTTELDVITRALDAKTRRDLQLFVGDLASAFHNRGEYVNDTLGSFEPFTSDTGSLLALLDTEHAAVRQLTHDTGVVFGALGQRQGQLEALIRAGDSVLSTTAARDRDLATAVHILPTTLAELRPTLSELERVAHDAAPVVHTLRPAARSLAPALTATAALAPDLKALFGGLDRVTTTSRTALPALTGIVESAHPLFDILVPTLRQALPVVDYLSVYKHEYVAQIALLADSLEAAASPGPGVPPLHYLRALVPFTTEGAAVQGRRLGSNRHNPYLTPLAMLKLPQGLEAFDCANLSNPSSPEPAPPCKVQTPLLFEGHRFAFPHVNLAP